jgi:hypothetical protein
MMTTSTVGANRYTVGAQARRSVASWWIWFMCIAGVSVLVCARMVLRGPDPAMIAWLCYAAGIVAIFYRPRFGVYLIVGWTLAADATLMWWYPFTKNLSSVESLMYVSKGVIFSPLESYVVLTYIAWLGRGLIQRKFNGRGGPLFWPAMVFAGFITFGLIYGQMHGGNLNVALWEVRSMYMLPAFLILVTNLIETPAQASRLIWIATIALLVKSIFGVLYVAIDLQFNIHEVESIADHEFSIHLNSLVVLALAAWMYRASLLRRAILTVLLPIVLFGIFANQRRAAFAALAVALLLMAVMLFIQYRRLFWAIAPVAVVVAGVYLGAFWNSSGTLGMPARAIKSVIAPSSVSARDAASDVYRILENIDTMFTIKSAPLTGIGFGNKFYRIVPLADISFFVFYQYITHNSIMWVWMQIGAGGFFAMLYLIGAAVMQGARLTLQMPGGDLSAIALAATVYIVMHFVYAYVDMSWDASNMIYIGVMMGLVNCLKHIVGTQQPVAARR